MTSRKAIVEPLVRLVEEQGLPNKVATLGPQLPPIKSSESLHHFRRVQVREPAESIHDMDTAKAILRTDPMQPAANTFLGLRLVQDARRTQTNKQADKLLDTAIRHLETALASGRCFRVNRHHQPTAFYLISYYHRQFRC